MGRNQSLSSLDKTDGLAFPNMEGHLPFEDLDPRRPVEGYFEMVDYEIRKQAYWSVFAGAFGHTYGNNNIWQMNRDDQSSRIWPNRTWDKALESPGAGQLIHFRRLMESRPFLSRIPDQGILIGESDASYIMAYLPYYKSFKINTSVIAGTKMKEWVVPTGWW